MGIDMRSVYNYVGIGETIIRPSYFYLLYLFICLLNQITRIHRRHKQIISTDVQCPGVLVDLSVEIS